MPRWIKHWEVESTTKAGLSYKVSQAEDGSWGCSCPQWKFRKQPICKHIVEVQSQLKATAGRSNKPHVEPTMTIIEITNDSPGWYW